MKRDSASLAFRAIFSSPSRKQRPAEPSRVFLSICFSSRNAYSLVRRGPAASSALAPVPLGTFPRVLRACFFARPYASIRRRAVFSNGPCARSPLHPSAITRYCQPCRFPLSSFGSGCLCQGAGQISGRRCILCRLGS